MQSTLIQQNVHVHACIIILTRQLVGGRVLLVLIGWSRVILYNDNV